MYDKIRTNALFCFSRIVLILLTFIITLIFYDALYDDICIMIDMGELTGRGGGVWQLECIEGAEAEGTEGKSQAFKVGKLNLVDLAGSERVRCS